MSGGGGGGECCGVVGVCPSTWFRSRRVCGLLGSVRTEEKMERPRSGCVRCGTDTRGCGWFEKGTGEVACSSGLAFKLRPPHNPIIITRRDWIDQKAHHAGGHYLPIRTHQTTAVCSCWACSILGVMYYLLNFGIDTSSPRARVVHEYNTDTE